MFYNVVSPNHRNQTPYGVQPYQHFHHPQPLEPPIDCVIEPQNGIGGLYIGSIDGALNVQLLKSQNIKYVLTLSYEQEVKYQPQDNIVHNIMKCRDLVGFQIIELFKHAHQFIDESRKVGNIFVHCMAGISRSASVILSYLMWRRRMNLESSLTYLKGIRNCVRPNPGFLRQLLEFERELYGNISSNLNSQITPYYAIQNEPQFKQTINYNYESPVKYRNQMMDSISILTNSTKGSVFSQDSNFNSQKQQGGRRDNSFQSEKIISQFTPGKSSKPFDLKQSLIPSSCNLESGRIKVFSSPYIKNTQPNQQTYQNINDMRASISLNGMYQNTISRHDLRQKINTSTQVAPYNQQTIPFVKSPNY